MKRAGIPAALALVLASTLWGAQIQELRPIQVDYPSQTARSGGQIIALWKADGAFDEIRIVVDGKVVRVVAGITATTGLGDLPLGERQVTVQGMVDAAVASELTATLTVRAAPPIPGVEPDACLFHSYREGEGGHLDFYWKNRDSPEDPYVDFAIYVNGDLQGTLAAPATAHTFTKVALGAYSIEVIAFTLNHLCEPALIHCTAEIVAPVIDSVCRLERCGTGQGFFLITYSLPPGPVPDGVAAFDVTEPASPKHLGNVSPGRPVAPPPLEPGAERQIELVAYRRDSANTVPGGPGEHVVVTCFLPDGGCTVPRFIRGDSNGDGGLDITDDIFSLGYLFLGGAKPGCLSACDVNSDGNLDLSDPIFGLQFKFLGGPEPGAPFPRCGEDPDAGRLECTTGC